MIKITSLKPTISYHFLAFYFLWTFMSCQQNASNVKLQTISTSKDIVPQSSFEFDFEGSEYSFLSSDSSPEETEWTNSPYSTTMTTTSTYLPSNTSYTSTTRTGIKSDPPMLYQFNDYEEAIQFASQFRVLSSTPSQLVQFLFNDANTGAPIQQVLHYLDDVAQGFVTNWFQKIEDAGDLSTCDLLAITKITQKNCFRLQGFINDILRLRNKGDHVIEIGLKSAIKPTNIIFPHQDAATLLIQWVKEGLVSNSKEGIVECSPYFDVRFCLIKCAIIWYYIAERRRVSWIQYKLNLKETLKEATKKSQTLEKVWELAKSMNRYMAVGFPLQFGELNWKRYKNFN